MALGRRGLGGANPSRGPLVTRRSLASGSETGGSAAGCHGAVKGAGSSGCTDGGLTEVNRLRNDFFAERRRLWEADRKLFGELARLEMQIAKNMVDAKVDGAFATFKILGCAALFFFGVATFMEPYVIGSIVHRTVIEVEERLRIRKAEGTLPHPEGRSAATPPPAARAPHGEDKKQGPQVDRPSVPF
ncbi:hypothetical protein ZWY2020_023528 [Hordeum vulgare]|nr:hypothetical protein ZWY2020_023528 [Hordeum vulgare]